MSVWSSKGHFTKLDLIFKSVEKNLYFAEFLSSYLIKKQFHEKYNRSKFINFLNMYLFVFRRVLVVLFNKKQFHEKWNRSKFINILITIIVIFRDFFY